MLPENFWPAFTGSILFGAAGVLLAAFGYKVFDWITPRINVEEELAGKQNLAVAIVVAAIILGSFYLMAAVCN